LVYWKEALAWKFGLNSPNITHLGRERFDSLLGPWGACTDQPAVAFAPELVSAYPEAKVVLVERDVENWFASYSEVVIYSTDSWSIPFLERIDNAFIRPMANQTDLIARYYFGVTEKWESWCLNNPAFFAPWRKNARATYVAHNEMVKRVTPSERLLLFRLEDGWEPLCIFLGKKVPNIPFPKVNETAAIKEKIDLYLAEGYKWGMIRTMKDAMPYIVGSLAVLG
jgi:hypothetical protein